MIIKDRKNKILIILAVLLVSLTVRLGLALSSHLIPSLTSDAAGYDESATHLLSGRGFINGKGEPTSWREPLYPIFLSGIYYLFGHNYTAVKILQAFIGALTCIIIYLIASSLFSVKIGLISAFIASFNPTFIKLTENLMTENLFIFFLILSMYFLLRYYRESGSGNLFFCAVTLGMATLTRSVTIFLPLLIILFVAVHRRVQTITRKQLFLNLVIFTFSFFLTLMPWTIRNWRVHHRLIFVTSRMGLGIYTSYVPIDGKRFGFNAQDEITKRSELISSEVERSDFLVKETVKYIKRNPDKILRLEILKMLFFWCPFDWAIIGEGVYNYVYGFILPFFIFGCFKTAKRIQELAPIYLPIINALLFSLLTFGLPRFRMPVEPYILIIAAVGINLFFNLFVKKIYPLLLTIIFFLLNFWFYFSSPQVKLFAKTILEKLSLW